MKNTINLIDVKTDNMTDYKKTSLLLVFPYCSGKCEGCQNYILQQQKGANKKEYKIDDIVQLYNNMSTHKAIVCAGLEPFDSFEELENLMKVLFVNNNKAVDFVVYTGFYLSEIDNLVRKLLKYVKNENKTLIIKTGRYVPNVKNSSWYSDVLGVDIATNNQQVIKYSWNNKQKCIDVELDDISKYFEVE